MERMTRRKAIRRKRIFLGLVSAGLILIVGLIAAVVVLIARTAGKGAASSASGETKKPVSSSSAVSSGVSSADSSAPEYVQLGDYQLDANYKNLMLVNAAHPLPENYDYEANLTTIDAKYINGSLNQIDKNVYPYLKAMIEAAWADGVKLYVRSPYRSYAIQKMLFEKQVQRAVAAGTPAGAQAEAKAATVVVRPGASEHHTGLAADFNMAEDQFEQTEMFTWMQQHAAEYGFILRYPKDKTAVTGVIYESWHYRFVGINTAKKIKQSGLCLEEYLDSTASQTSSAKAAGK